ncbi:hypothetical protein ALC56_06562 [Trachymyrmex septentrionalis]|uniref:Uncharacterized protein n=1 Tax=Trachymyrmex septentrionalis TaxID=34720 RepID=A0A195FFK6_9HYME|nr:PREDICTED: uncharacterized protein LOC108748730 [Trachymyrmex septentrionalis]KYN39136.1 hypothetical protein ALC56_06562 [Trachymyrmex septentrionalis]
MATNTELERPCTYEFSKGFGTGAAEALGNWGFSNRTCSAGQELQRLKCLFAKMDSLRSADKPMMCVKYDRRYDPEAWYVKPSPDECKPAWTFPVKRPLITYCSTTTILKVSNMLEIGGDLKFHAPGRSFVHQGTDKWYRGSNCCYQPSCLAPQCPVRYSCES